MSTHHFDGAPHTLLASVRKADYPFSNKDRGHLVGIDYADFTGGGMSNVRLTRRQAMALRDALCAFFSRGLERITIGESIGGEGVGGKLRSEEQDGAHRMIKLREREKLSIINPYPVKREDGGTIKLGICPVCGHDLLLSRSNKLGARCHYEGTQFDADGKELYSLTDDPAKIARIKKAARKGAAR